MQPKRKRRPTIYTPGFKFDDISFTPTREEYTFDWLRAKQEKWAKEDEIRRRKRFAEIHAAVNRDRQETQRQEMVERELEKVQSYFRTELEKEAQSADDKRRAALAKITKHIARDKARVERETLAARGVLRGRR
jgi:hypothetical protein